MGQRVMVTSKVKPVIGGAVAKASLNRATELVDIDPKRYELGMGRLKACESVLEDRTGWSCKSFR